jgi:hypothetical protein
MTGFFSVTGFLLTIQTPQLPPDVQYLQLEQLLQALQVALPVHLADEEKQQDSFVAFTEKMTNKKEKNTNTTYFI